MAPTALPEELRFYVVRAGDAIIPLVPVDQLPPCVELEGIPRQLTPRQRSDEGWKPTCDTYHPAVSLQIKTPSPSVSHRQLSPIEVRLPPAPEASSQYLAPDDLVRSEAKTASEASRQASQYASRSTIGERYSGQPCTLQVATPEHMTSSADAPSSKYFRESLRLRHCGPHPSGLTPDHSKKVYCTHWMRTGSCDFAQVGCKYKHEMPSKGKLLELGIRETPLWWKEKQAIRTPTWMDERRAFTKISEREPPPPPTHDRMSWINGLSLKLDAQNKDDQLISTPEQRPASDEIENLVSSTTTQAGTQGPVCAPRCAFVDDLIDLRDDTDDSTDSDAAMDASSRGTEASSGTRSSSSQPSPIPQPINDDAIATRSSSGDALQGDKEQHPDPQSMVSSQPVHDHNDTQPKESACNNIRSALRSTRSYHEPEKHNGLATLKHATARTESPQSIEAHDKSAASNANQPAGKDVHAVVKKKFPGRKVKPAKQRLTKDTIRGDSE